MPSDQPIPGHNDYSPILQRHLEEDQYQLVSCGRDTPTLEEINSFAADVGVKFPNDFIDFSVSQLGGLYVAVKESLWPRPKGYQGGPFWSFLYGFYVYGFAKGIPDFMDIRIQTDKFRARSRTNLVPCLKIAGDANIYAFTPDGTLCRWNHELGEYPPTNQTFLEILDRELGELAARKARKLGKQGGGPSVV